MQRKILALLWQDVDSYLLYRSCVKPQYFSKSIEIDICREIYAYWDKYDKAPTEAALIEEITSQSKTMKSKEKVLGTYIEAIKQMAEMEIDDFHYLRDKITAFGRRQALTQAIIESADIIQKGDIDKFSEVDRLIEEAQAIGRETNNMGLDWMENYEERFDSYLNEEDVIERIPTGSPALDKILGGGLGRTEMGVVLASPGKGKTTALVNFGAYATKCGYSVVHISFENNIAQIARNYDLCALKRDFTYVKEHIEKSKKAFSFVKKLGKGSLHIIKYQTKGADIQDIRGYLKRIQNIKGKQIDVVIIDYGTIMAPSRKYSEKRHEVSGNFEEIRALADEFNAAVWTAAQGNRASLSKKVVTIGDLAEDLSIANTSDIIIALCQTEKEKYNGTMRGFLTKVRDSESSRMLQGSIDYAKKQLVFDEDITDQYMDGSQDGDWEEEDQKTEKKRRQRQQNSPT